MATAPDFSAGLQPDFSAGLAPVAKKPTPAPAPAKPVPPPADPYAQGEGTKLAMERGFLGGAADIVNTLITPKQFGQDALDAPLTRTRDWLRNLVPEQTAKNRTEAVAQTVAGVAGGFIPGAAEYLAGPLFAAAHGIKTATDNAEEHGRTASAGEMAWDGLVEAGMRKAMGFVSARSMGRSQTGLAFGAITGAQDVAEAANPYVPASEREQRLRTINRAVTDGGINFLIGVLTGGMSADERVALEKARAENAHGNQKGAMAHLNPILLKHGAEIAAAARNLGVDSSVEKVPPPEERVGGPPPTKGAVPPAAPAQPTPLEQAIAAAPPKAAPILAPETSAPPAAPAKPGSTQALDPDQIGVDAQRFQFKSNANEQGVTDRLLDVNKWNPYLAGVTMVFRDTDGKLWIADGHQRLALAKRMKAAGQSDVFLNAHVLDAKDGWTDVKVRAYAAAKNISEGTGTPIDAAKVIRDAQSTGIELPPLPPRSVLVRDGQALANLGEEAWGMAVNEVVPPNQAALVGRLVADHAQQAEAIRILKKADPANMRQAEMMVRDMLSMGTETMKTQGGLFGEEEFAASAVLERAKIADSAAKQIAKDRAVFRTLVNEAGRITEHGQNVLDSAANKGRLSTDDQAAALLTQLATRHGPVSDALTELAKRLKAGDISVSDATKSFVRTLRDRMEKGLERGADVGGGQSGDAGKGPEGLAEEKAPYSSEPGAVDAKGKPLPQLIIPGAEPSAAQAAKAREAAGKGLKTSKVAQKEAGPLFAPGEGAAGGKQGTLFVDLTPMEPGTEAAIKIMAEHSPLYGKQINLMEAPRFEDQFPKSQFEGQTPEDQQLGIADYLRRRGAETFHETMVIYDGIKGRVTHAFTSGQPMKVKWSGSDADSALRDPNNNLIIHHNHPTGQAVSAQDIAQGGLPGLSWIIAHGPRGEFSASRLTPKFRAKVRELGWDMERTGLFIKNVAQRISRKFVTGIKAYIKDGRITAADANAAHAHFVAEALRQAGFIDYTHNLEVKPNVERTFREVAPRFLPNKPSGAVQLSAGIARVLAESGKPAGQHAEAVAPRGLSGVPAAGRKPEQLTLLDEPAPHGAPEEDLLPHDVTEASLATRVTHMERAMAVARRLLEGAEQQFHGMTDDQRMAELAAYQQGGVDAVPEARKAFWTKFRDMLAKQYSSEHAAGIEYEERTNYAPVYWENERAAKEFYDANPRPPDQPFRKPSFTKGKVFDDVLEGVALGFKLKTTNPAVLAIMRIEQGERAKLRILSMRDAVEDGNSIALSEAQEAGKARAKERKLEITKRELLKMVASDQAHEVKEINADRKKQGLDPIRGNFRLEGTEYQIVPEAIQRLRIKLKHVNDGSMPKEYNTWGSIDVGGSRYLVRPETAELFKRALQMDRQQFTDLLRLPSGGKASKIEKTLWGQWMALRNATIPIKLVWSAFHAIHVLQIEMAQPIAAALEQGLNQKLSVSGFIKAVNGSAGAASRRAYGHVLAEEFSRPDEELSPIQRLEQNILLAGGMNVQKPSIYEIHAKETIRRTLGDVLPSLRQQAAKENWSTLKKTWKMAYPHWDAYVLGPIGRITDELLQGPLFSEVIPSMKAAAYLNQAKLHLATHPELLENTAEAHAKMRIALSDIRRSIDNRFGEMQYDKLFWPSLVKKGLFGTFLSVGWNLGFLREFGGGLTVDLYGTAKRAFQRKGFELTTRTVYASTYLFFGYVFLGTLNYLLSGKPPQEPKDFLYPKLPDGTRITSPLFNREFGAAYYHILQEGWTEGTETLIENKLAPSMQAFLEVLNNQDYFGNQIYDTNAPFWDQFGQAMGHYAVGAFVPITFENILEHPGESPEKAALGFGGFTAAPKYIEHSTTQARIERAYREQHPQEITPYAEAERVGAWRDLKTKFKALQASGSADDEAAYDKAIEAYVAKFPQYLSKGWLRKAERNWLRPEGASEFRDLDRETQKRILKDASPAERQQFAPYAHPDVRQMFGGPQSKFQDMGETPEPMMGYDNPTFGKKTGKPGKVETMSFNQYVADQGESQRPGETFQQFVRRINKQRRGMDEVTEDVMRTERERAHFGDTAD